MKIAPIVKALRERCGEGRTLPWRLVHTGQHYDAAMSGDFFTQLGLPAPDVQLGAGSGSQATQTAAIMTAYEDLLLRAPAAACLVVGDVTSTMACAITARKLSVPVAHVEAGLRSGDWSMPEEINRRVTDAVSNWLFTTSETAGVNLSAEGVESSRIFFVGNTMIDSLLANLDRLQPPDFWQPMGLSPRGYLLLTLHRPANVDCLDRLVGLIRAIADNARDLPVVFPVHPRTEDKLRNISRLPQNIQAVSPQPYFEFIHLVKHAFAVLTDSGGLTEETTVLGVPCLTLRETTERPETVEIGTNELVGTEPADIEAAAGRLFAGHWKTGRIPDKWDGQAGRRIAAILGNLLTA